MFESFLADAAVVLHFLFVLFVMFGGFLLLWRPRFIWVHAPAVVWAFWIELSGRVCPLTYLEAWLRLKSGEAGYRGGFVEHYILPVLYPEHLTRSLQIALGFLALAFNGIIYIGVLRRSRKHHP